MFENLRKRFPENILIFQIFSLKFPSKIKKIFEEFR